MALIARWASTSTTDNMLVLTDITTKQLAPTEITIEWYLQSSTEDFNDYRMSIYRASGKVQNVSEYDLVISGINPALTSFIQDTNVHGLTSKFIDYFYIVVLSGLSGQGVFTSLPYAYSAVIDKYAREIERRRNLVFDYHSGQEYSILKRKQYGTYCPDCYDVTLQRTTSSSCLTCYGTGFAGGYYSDINIRGQLNERPVREIHQMFGAWQDSDAVLYCPASPPINPKDIIVDRLTRRWIVLNVGTAAKALHTISQICQVRQIEKDDIINHFPVIY